MNSSCLTSPIIYRPNHLTHLTFECCFKPLFLLHWPPTVLAILFASTASVCATVESSNPSALHHEFQRSQGTPPVHHPFCPVRVSVMGMSHDGHPAIVELVVPAGGRCQSGEMRRWRYMLHSCLDVSVQANHLLTLLHSQCQMYHCQQPPNP